MQCIAVLLAYTWITSASWDVVIEIKPEQLQTLLDGTSKQFQTSIWNNLWLKSILLFLDIDCVLLVYCQIFYKDDMNWLKGVGCYAWDTPEILRCKQAMKLQSEVSMHSPLLSVAWLTYLFTLLSELFFLAYFRTYTELKELSIWRTSLW